MKPENLMIGDWVLYNPNVFIEDEYESPKDCYPTKISCGEDIDVAIEDCYSPILLTAEILEKNGFVKNEYGEMILEEELGTSEIYIVLEPTYDEDYYWWGVNYVLITKIKSVHELQHVLRLVGIEKEIIV